MVNTCLNIKLIIFEIESNFKKLVHLKILGEMKSLNSHKLFMNKEVAKNEFFSTVYDIIVQVFKITKRWKIVIFTLPKLQIENQYA